MYGPCGDSKFDGLAAMLKMSVRFRSGAVDKTFQYKYIYKTHIVI